MKIKKVLCLLLTITVLGQTSLTLASEEISELSAAQPSEVSISEEEIPSEQEPQAEPSTLDLSTFVSTDDKGTVTIPESGIFDFLFPEEIGGESVYRIGPGAFKGCSYFRAIAIPTSITEIGEDAFADCPNLEKIILLGRADDQDITLGENWSGNAQVIYEQEKVDEEILTEPVEETNDPNQEVSKEETLSAEVLSEPAANEEETVPEISEEITDEPAEEEALKIEETEETTSPDLLPAETEEDLPAEETPIFIEEESSVTEISEIEESEEPIEEILSLD